MCVLSPQQDTEPSVRTPQAWVAPALTVLNVPAGGVDWPAELLPQQTSVPLWIAQLKPWPTDSALNVPEGGVVAPVPLGSVPMQLSDPFVKIPQL